MLKKGHRQLLSILQLLQTATVLLIWSHSYVSELIFKRPYNTIPECVPIEVKHVKYERGIPTLFFFALIDFAVKPTPKQQYNGVRYSDHCG